MDDFKEWLGKNASWLIPFLYLVYKDIKENQKKAKKKGASSRHKKKRHKR